MLEPAIILITGIMASGKSTVAQHLAERFTKSVHLRGDVFRRMIVNGRVEMEADFSQAAYDQLHLRYQLAVNTAQTYCRAGFTVVYQDVVIGPDLKMVVDMFRNAETPLYVVVLCPSVEVVAMREAARQKTGYTSWSVESLNKVLHSETPRLGWWVDTSALSVEETVDTILQHLE